MKSIPIDDSVGWGGVGAMEKKKECVGCVCERESACERERERERESEREREVSWSVWAMEICREVLDSGDKRLQAKFKHALNVIDRTLALYKSVSIYFPSVFPSTMDLAFLFLLSLSCLFHVFSFGFPFFFFSLQP